jgi:DNA replication protein DnaC
VLYLTFEELLTRLKRALAEQRLTQTLQQLTYPRVLILDLCGVDSYVE